MFEYTKWIITDVNLRRAGNIMAKGIGTKNTTNNGR
jgi:hypothetical protein